MECNHSSVNYLGNFPNDDLAYRCDDCSVVLAHEKHCSCVDCYEVKETTKDIPPDNLTL